jgi:ubiquinone/menaquinone biosynthesis C-methylase UbiE
MFRVKEDMAILDVGCGTGAHLALYTRTGCKLYGIDPSPSMIGVAREQLGDRAQLHLGDAADMPYDDGSFDLVLCMLTLHEMAPATRSAVLGEMGRVLRDGGRMLLIDFHPGPHDWSEAWLPKTIIFLSEVGAGRRHYGNYRHFMGIGGLPGLADEHGLVVHKQRIVAGGAMALLLVGVL